MFSRYINLPEKTAAEFSGVFFKTGDIAAREVVGNEGAYFKILGRASMVMFSRHTTTNATNWRNIEKLVQDIIKSGGHKISALEIERVSHFHTCTRPPRIAFHFAASRSCWNIRTFLLLPCVAYRMRNTGKWWVLWL